MVASSGAAIPGRGASETSGKGAGVVEDARGIGQGRPVVAGFGSALFELKRRKDETEGGAWGENGLKS